MCSNYYDQTILYNREANCDIWSEAGQYDPHLHASINRYYPKSK